MPLKHSVEEIELQSGVKGLIVHVPDSTVMSYTIHFRAGNDYARSPDIHQTAHLMEHLAFGPNAQFATMEAFSQEFSRNGAYSNASTYDTNMHYYADCAQFEWERILALQQLAITQPRYLPENLAAEKGNVREEFAGYAHNNNRRLWQRINRAMGGHSLYDEEKTATIDAVEIDDIKEHHTRTHTLRNMRFVLAGNFENSSYRVKEMLSEWKLPTGERLAPLVDTLHSAEPLAIKRTDQENVGFGLTYVLPRKLEIPELVVFSAINHLLTGTLHSRIFGRARMRGICYGIGSSTATDIGGTSSWDFYGQVRPDNAGALFDLMTHEIQRVLDGDITATDISDAKQYLTGDYQMRGQTVASLASWYSGDYFFDDTIDDITQAQRYIDAITRDEMVRLAREFVAADIWTLGEIGAVEQTDVQHHFQTLGKLPSHG